MRYTSSRRSQLYVDVLLFIGFVIELTFQVRIKELISNTH